LPGAVRLAIRLALACSFLCIWRGAVAQTDEQRFTEAGDLIARGEYANAAERLITLADTAPSGELADLALTKAAELFEHNLGDPQRAAELYERVARQYSRRRLARRAERRAAELRAALGEKGEYREALTRYLALVNRQDGSPALEGVESMKALLREFPEFPRAAEATFWIGAAYERVRWFDAALEWFTRVRSRFPGSDAAHRALLRIGDVHLATGAFEAAEQAYRQLAAEQAGAADWLDDALAGVERERERLHRARWSWVVVFLFTVVILGLARRDAGSWRAVARNLSRPPVELLYLFPLLAGICALSLALNALVSRAILFISAGSLFITWLSGAVAEGYRRRHPSVSGRHRAILHAALALSAALAICYLALAEERLLDLLVETFRSGPED
jgi:TolA-binding protein